MKHLLKFVLSLSVLCSLSSCGWLFGDQGFFPSKADDYLEAEQSAALQVPDELEGDALGNEYPVPELLIPNPLPESFTVPRVDSLEEVGSRGAVKIQSLDDSRWILVNAPATRVWPLIKQFFASNQIDLDVEQGLAGFVETTWLRRAEGNSEASSAKQPESITSVNSHEKYRIFLRSGVQRNTSEVSVVQKTAAIVDGNREDAPWREQSYNTARESNMVNLLAEHLAGSAASVSHSLLAQGIGSASKVHLMSDAQGKPYLNLELGFNRGWGALGLALQKASFEVNDVDRTQGLYFVYFVEKDDKKKPGFFKRLLSFGNKKNEKGKKYIVSMHEQAEGLVIRIALESSSTEPLSANEKVFLLKRIQGKLS